jgi:hypothetical protein
MYFCRILGDYQAKIFIGFFDLTLEFLGDFFQFELATLPLGYEGGFLHSGTL